MRHGPPTGEHVSVLPRTDPAVAEAEHALSRHGFALPLQSRLAWVRHLGTSADRYLLAFDGAGGCAALVAASLSRTRALPGHRLLRLDSIGDAYAIPAGRSLLREATRLARSSPRILRAVVALQCREQPNKDYLHDELRSLGYRRIKAERVSEQTLGIDLRPAEADVLRGFRDTVRQRIRDAGKYGRELVPIDSDRYADRMNAILAETMARTGARSDGMNWPAIVEVCRALPDRCRLVGVFQGGSRDADDLLGYVLGFHHGDRAEYSTGASTRRPDLKGSVLHPALWVLITWAKTHGASWFDLGGVTAGSHGTQDALGGISDFKRGFSKDLMTVGEEWALEPRRWKWRLAEGISRTAHRLRARRSAAREQR